MLRDLVLIADIDRRDKNQTRLTVLHALNRIKHLHRALIVHRLRPLLSALPSRARAKVHDVRFRVLERAREVGRGRVLEREHAGRRAGGGDGGGLRGVADDGGDFV